MWLANGRIVKKSINTFAIAVFFRQFATLLAAGIPLLLCCDILEKSQASLPLRLLIRTIKRDIMSGRSLSFCIAQHSRYFNELLCQLIRIGEHTGRLDLTLTMIAVHLEKNLAFQQRIKQALFYPSIVLFVGLSITLSMFIFVIPRFAELFKTSSLPLPILTRWIFYLAEHLLQYMLTLGIVIFFVIFILHQLKLSAKLKQSLQQRLLALPFIRTIRQKILLARFSKNLAITFSAGIPIIEGLKLSAKTCADSGFSHTITQLRQQIAGGMQLHHAMTGSPIFPALMVQMVKIGEQSGMLAAMLEKLADFYEADLEQIFSRLGHLVEPLIMIILGVLIGGLVIGMYLPIFKLGNTL